MAALAGYGANRGVGGVCRREGGGRVGVEGEDDPIYMIARGVWHGGWLREVGEGRAVAYTHFLYLHNLPEDGSFPSEDLH